MKRGVLTDKDGCGLLLSGGSSMLSIGGAWLCRRARPQLGGGSWACDRSARVKVVKNSIISTASLAGSARARDDSRHINLTSSGPAQTSVRMEERA